MAKRGFFAEMQYQSEQTETRTKQQLAALKCKDAALLRQQDAARRDTANAQKQNKRVHAAERNCHGARRNRRFGINDPRCARLGDEIRLGWSHPWPTERLPFHTSTT
jgi:hypothetical protein